MKSSAVVDVCIVAVDIYTDDIAVCADVGDSRRTCTGDCKFLHGCAEVFVRPDESFHTGRQKRRRTFWRASFWHVLMYKY